MEKYIASSSEMDDRILNLNLSIFPQLDPLNLYGSSSSENSTFGGNYSSSSASENGTDALEIPINFTQMSKNAIISVITYSIVFVVAAAGNFSVFFSVLHQLRRTKSRISLFILHLSIADLLVTFGVIPLEIVWRITIQWYGGNLLCKVCKVFSAFGLYLSSTVLICISLDRYFAIIHPLRLTDARRRGRIMLTIAWITAAVCSAPQSMIFYVEHHPIYPSVHQCVSILYFYKDVELIYNLFSVFVMYFLPLLIIFFTYGMILCKISRKSRQDGESRNDVGEASGRILLRRSDNRMERAKSRTLRLTFVIVVVFVLCWTPYVVMTLWYMFDRESAEKVDGLVQDGLFIMAVANSCVNPLVYGSFTKECRKSMTSCCGCCGANGAGDSDVQVDIRNGNHKLMYSGSRRSNSYKASFRSRSPADGHGHGQTHQNHHHNHIHQNGRQFLALNNKHTNVLRTPSDTATIIQSLDKINGDAAAPKNIQINVPTTKIVNNQLMLELESPFQQEINEFYSKPGSKNGTSVVNHYNSSIHLKHHHATAGNGKLIETANL